jgi:acyl carrier protein
MLIQSLRDTPEAERKDVLMQHISAMIKDILELNSTETFEPEQRLSELGLHSRVVIELKGRLETAFSVDLPVTLFFQHSTLEMLTTHLLTKVLQLAASRQVLPTTPVKQLNSEPMILERLEQLSEEEAEVRILEKIAEVEKRMKP